MADGTKIEWTDATWNPITGCAVVSPGCTNCYAMKLAGTRLKNHSSRKGLTKDTKTGPVWTGEVRLNRQWLDQPLRWTTPRMIFVCAHGDLFAEGVDQVWIDYVFAVMALAPQHTFQVLTKRPERMREYMLGMSSRRSFIAGYRALVRGGNLPDHYETAYEAIAKPLPNVWLGVSVEDQRRAEERIPLLLDTPAAIRWISAEPLLGPLDLTCIRQPNAGSGPWWFDALTTDRMGWFHDEAATKPTDEDPLAFSGYGQLDWVVAGGESSPGARPMHPDWARQLRDQCAAAGVPFLFKQWGAFAPMDVTFNDFAKPADDWLGTLIAGPAGQLDQFPSNPERVIALLNVGKKAAGRLLDGIEHNGFPEVRR